MIVTCEVVEENGKNVQEKKIGVEQDKKIFIDTIIIVVIIITISSITIVAKLILHYLSLTSLSISFSIRYCYCVEKALVCVCALRGYAQLLV